MPYYLRNGMISHRHPFQGCGACNGVGAVDPVTAQAEASRLLGNAAVAGLITYGAAGAGAYLGYRKSRSVGWAIAGGVGGYVGGALLGMLFLSSTL